MKADILIVDDEADIREVLRGLLEDEGFAIRVAASSEEAYARIGDDTPDLVILDIWLQGSKDDGLEVLKNIRKKHGQLPVLMISGHGTIETAVSAIKQGAYDFIEKPFKTDRLLLLIERALETATLRRENETLKQRINGPSEMIGHSSVMQLLQQTLLRVAQTNSRVLITGEPGTGKDLAARFIHSHSQRASGPFVALNCAIMRPEWLETELFGSEPAIAGDAVKIGVLEQANGGTLLLDEVSDMPLETQGKILRVLQEQKFQRVGGQHQIESDVRIISTTNRDLQKCMAEGSFRQDLYYRLSVVPVFMPPLRERIEDIAELSSYFSDIYAAQSGRHSCSFDPAAIAVMQSYNWPGNARQLRNVVEWCLIMGTSASDNIVKPHHLPPEITKLPNEDTDQALQSPDLVSLPLREAREEFEKTYLAAQIRRFGSNISKTAEFVGMERSALHRKIKQLGIVATGKPEPDEDSEPFRESA